MKPSGTRYVSGAAEIVKLQPGFGANLRNVGPTRRVLCESADCQLGADVLQVHPENLGNPKRPDRGWRNSVTAYEALDLSEQLKPDVILADMALLGGNSFDVTGRMKARLPETRIIMFSALGGKLTITQPKRCGADFLVPKDTPISGILGAIRQTVTGRLG